MIEPNENGCLYDEAKVPSIAAAPLLVVLLFMVGCGPSNEDKKSTEATEKIKADAVAEQLLLSDPDRAKTELIRRLRASVKMRDGLLIVSDPILSSMGFLTVLPASSAWVVKCGAGITVVFGTSVGGKGEEVGNEVEVTIANYVVPKPGCETLAPAIGKEIQAIIGGG
jgi:hypothetical protein